VTSCCTIKTIYSRKPNRRVMINAWIKSGRCIGVSNLRCGFKLPHWQFEPRFAPRPGLF